MINWYHLLWIIPIAISSGFLFGTLWTAYFKNEKE